MLTNETTAKDDQEEINLTDVVDFLKLYYKKIIVVTIIGITFAVLACVIFGTYTATITLNNYSGLDIPRIKYLQSALPKLSQEYQFRNKSTNDNFLSKENIWIKSIKPNILVSKADGKELLDSTSLNSAGSRISSIQIIGQSSSKINAENKVELISSFFINGSTYIELRDLIRAYELKVISIDSNLKKKINTAEIELDYLQKRIKNLNDLKTQYPNTGGNLGQILDTKDSGAKYLPITTQIVAATTDVNNLKESLAKYKDEESQNIVYKQFVEKAKPIIETVGDENNLADKLLSINSEIEQGVKGNVQQLAIEDIKVAVSAIQTNKMHGLKQIGTVDISSPPYAKYALVGLMAGLVFGFLLAFGLKIRSQIKGN